MPDHSPQSVSIKYSRRSFAVFALALFVAALLGGATARAADKPTVTIYNLLSHPILDQSIAGIKESLTAHGFTKNAITLVEVNANGQFELLNAFAKEILSAKPTVVVPVSTPVTQAVVKEASPKQAIVFSTVTNPVDVGMDKQLPNMTGVSDVVNYEANIDLIKALFPQARKIGMVYNPGERNSQFGVEAVKKIVRAKNLKLQLTTASNSSEVVDAARAIVTTVDVIYVGSDNTVVSALEGLLAVADEKKIPVIASDVGSVEKGALAAVSVDYHKLGRRVGDIVAEVLRTGKSPGEIKNVMFYGDSLILNQKAARQLKFEFPALFRAVSARIIDAK